MLARLRNDESGFGLVELLAALIVLNIGIFAIIAAFNSGAVTLRRASQVSTATAIADARMERYRVIRYAAIGLSADALAAADATYTGDPAYGANGPMQTATCETLPPECKPTTTEPGPDNRSYRVDTYIALVAPTADGAGRPVKAVTVVVRDATDLTRTFVRQQSTFDLSTGS